MKTFKFNGSAPGECFGWLRTYAGPEDGPCWSATKKVEPYDTDEYGKDVIGARWVTVIYIHDDKVATMFALRWLEHV